MLSNRLVVFHQNFERCFASFESAGGSVQSAGHVGLDSIPESAETDEDTSYDILYLLYAVAGLHVHSIALGQLPVRSGNNQSRGSR